MPSKTARAKAKAQKSRQQQSTQSSNAADNPNNPLVGPSLPIPASSSFPGTGNVTGSSSAQTGSNDSLAVNVGSPDPTIIPSGLTIRIPQQNTIPSTTPLPPITEDDNPSTVVINSRRPTGGIIINEVRHNPGHSNTSTSRSSRSSRSSCSSHRTSDKSDKMSDTACRLRRADKQPHHGAHIPKDLDDVKIQEALFDDARWINEAGNVSMSSSNPSMELRNAMSSMSSIIRNELGSRLNNEQLTALEERLSVSSLINAAINQLHAPQGSDESDEAFNLRQMSLRRLQDPIRAIEMHSNSDDDLDSDEEVERIRAIIGHRTVLPDYEADLSEGAQDNEAPVRTAVTNGQDGSPARRRVETDIIMPENSLSVKTGTIFALKMLLRERLNSKSSDLNAKLITEERLRVATIAENRLRNERNEIIPSIPPAQDVPRNPDWISRVALQRTCFHHLREFGKSNIADQGVGFDRDGNLHECDRTADEERNTVAAYFLRNNLAPGRAFGPEINATAGRVPQPDRDERMNNARPPV
ncbi:hypothetical protein C8J56DRAFT_897492 [Mycena floridula]|nr:hypothetical protein C8J56DRAFT_897492 [Mycena floridula]